MKSRWDAWLRELARSGKGGVTLDAASRGRTYVLTINLPGDYTAATLAGRVRSSPDAPGDPLATFAIGTPSLAAGRYRLFCSLQAGTPESHEDRGMAFVLEVR